MSADGSELLAVIERKNREIIRQHPDFTPLQLMAAAGLAGYRFGADMLADSIKANLAMRSTEKRQA